MHSSLLLVLVTMLAPFVARAAPIAAEDATAGPDDVGTIYLPCCYSRSENSAEAVEVKV